MYRTQGALIFSTEFDGMWHWWYDEALARFGNRQEGVTPAKVRAQVRAGAKARGQADAALRQLMVEDHPASWWANEKHGNFVLWRQDHDIIARLLRGVGGKEPVAGVATRPSNGAVAGLKDRTVIEHSLVMNRGKLKARGKYEIPDSVHGMTSAIATHQTLLGDAIATEDPRLLAQALLAYPIRPNSAAQKSLYKALLKINAEEIPAALRRAAEYM